MKTLILTLLSLSFMVTSAQAARTITVSGSGTENTYCNPTASYFCIDDAKRRARSEAERNARWTCELNERGRALTYTAFFSDYCNPSYLPPNHNGTWVNCRADVRMSCEVEN
ncbi:MAG: hypothetical protein HUU57_08480 [Bdellovibrio sp.]|nr:hypothetical protein [Bdellovibrio sp.]